MTGTDTERVHEHLQGFEAALISAQRHADRLADWGVRLAETLSGGGRLLVAGNGGSAAEAQHLSAELVGRFREDRPAFSAIALTAESSGVTAISNDYGYDEVFARQVRAHGRPGDLLLTLSTSGESANLLAAVRTARLEGMTSWSMTGEAPNPLSAACDESVCFDGAPPHVQECHLCAIHALCAVFDAHVSAARVTGAPERNRS